MKFILRYIVLYSYFETLVSKGGKLRVFTGKEAQALSSMHPPSSHRLREEKKQFKIAPTHFPATNTSPGIKSPPSFQPRELLTSRASQFMMVGSVHLPDKSSWKCQQLTAEQLLTGRTVQSGREGITGRPSQYKSHLPGHSLPAKLGRTPCWASPL
jgi:hypothetical protein